MLKGRKHFLFRSFRIRKGLNLIPMRKSLGKLGEIKD